MKKMILLFAALAVSFPAMADFPAQTEPANPDIIKNIGKQVGAQVQQTIKKLESTDAHNRAVLDMTLRVHSRFTYQAQPGEQIYDKPCSAVLIDKNWLLASLSCRGVGEFAPATDRYNEYMGEKEVEYRHIEKASVYAKYFNATDIIPLKDIFVDENTELILLRVDRTNKKLAEEVDANGQVIANLLIPKNPNNVKLVAKQTYTNSRGFAHLGRSSSKIEIDNYNARTHLYTTTDDAYAGDALFVVSTKNPRAEYVVGFNNAIIDGGQPQTGNTFKALIKASLDAIKNIVQPRDPNAWERILSRVKIETQI